MTHPELSAPSARCPQCGTELAPSRLACPACGRLVHADHLKRLAAEAKAAATAGEVAAALDAWRRVYDLLPGDSRQARVVGAKIAELSRGLPAAAPPAPRRSLPLFATRGTVLSMLASFGIYAVAFGWELGLGLVLCIYVHELGHVAALRRYGLEPAALMFVPGLGAMVRWRGYPSDPVQDARIGLAGPLWGLGASLAAYVAYLISDSTTFGAIARAAAWLNLVNLVPLLPFDGGHGARALSRGHRWAMVAVLTLMWRVTGVPLLPVLVVAAVANALFTRRPPSGDHATFAEFALLVVALALLSDLIRVPVRHLLP